MNIVREPISTYVDKLICENCGGEMKQKGDVCLMSEPPKFTHICETCGNSIITNERYPAIRFIQT